MAHVAACNNADIGVGAAIAEGNQVWRINWADLATDAIKILIFIKAIKDVEWGTKSVIKPNVRKSKLAYNRFKRNIAIKNPQSPIRLSITACIADKVESRLVNQYIINKYDVIPIISQNTKTNTRLSDITNSIIALMNNDRVVLYLIIYGSSAK